MTKEELKLEILKTVFPVYKDLMNFKRVADDLYNWVAPEGLPSEKEAEGLWERVTTKEFSSEKEKNLPPKKPIKEKPEQDKKS
jgi:hypothetical protein